MILFRCSCGAAHAVRDDYAGGTAQCDKCGTHTGVPEASDPSVCLVYRAGGEADGEPMVFDEIPALMAAGVLSPIDLLWKGQRWVPLGSVVGEDMQVKAEPPGPEKDGGPLEGTIGELVPIDIEEEEEFELPPVTMASGPAVVRTSRRQSDAGSSSARVRKLVWVFVVLVLVYAGWRYRDYRKIVNRPIFGVDVGTVRAHGSMKQVGGKYLLSGGGTDIWGKADHCHFAYRRLPDAFTLTVRVQRVEAVQEWTKAGLMMRSQLAPASPSVSLVVSPQHGVQLQVRAGQGQETSAPKRVPQITSPVWLRLRRRGNQVQAFYSKDGSRWDDAGSASVKLAPVVFGGLCVVSHKPGTKAAAEFDSFDVDIPLLAAFRLDKAQEQAAQRTGQGGSGQGGQPAGKQGQGGGGRRPAQGQR